MIHYFRLIRFSNLLIVAATMYSVAGYLDVLFGQTYDELEIVFSLNFLLLVISTVLITAAGNVINDYFDVEIDEINCPERVTIGRFITKKTALRYYVLLNLSALLLVMVFGIKTQFYLGMLIQVLCILILWFYSIRLKQSFLFGNITVALCTGAVPLLVGLYFQYHYGETSLVSTYPFSFPDTLVFPFYIGLGFGVFAFLINLLREIIKDMEDIEGDQLIEAKTVPLTLGMQKARSLCLVLLGLSLLFAILFFTWISKDIIDLKAFYLLLLSILFSIYAGFILMKKLTIKSLKKANFSLKLSMVSGLFLPLYWLLQLI